MTMGSKGKSDIGSEIGKFIGMVADGSIIDSLGLR